MSEIIPTTTQRDDERIAVQGGRERGRALYTSFLKKCDGRNGTSPRYSGVRARAPLCEIGVAEAQRAEDGPQR